MNEPNSTSAAANPSMSEGQSANLAAGCSQDRFFHCNARESTNIPQNSTFRKASRYRRRLNEPLSMGAHLSCAMRLGDSKKIPLWAVMNSQLMTSLLSQPPSELGSDGLTNTIVSNGVVGGSRFSETSVSVSATNSCRLRSQRDRIEVEANGRRKNEDARRQPGQSNPGIRPEHPA